MTDIGRPIRLFRNILIAVICSGTMLCGPAAAIFGGSDAEEGGWPFTVYVEAGEGPCTGTLVHPEIVVTAAHCIVPGKQALIGFGRHRANLERRMSAQCRVNPKWDGRVGGEDYGYCRLDTPVSDVPIAEIASRSEVALLEVGQEIIIVGFGVTEDGTSGGKRYAKTKISKVDGALRAGGQGTDACVGDSGSPALLAPALDSPNAPFRVLGFSSGGRRCGTGGVYVPGYRTVPWLEQDSGLRLGR